MFSQEVVLFSQNKLQKVFMPDRTNAAKCVHLTIISQNIVGDSWPYWIDSERIWNELLKETKTNLEAFEMQHFCSGLRCSCNICWYVILYLPTGNKINAKNLFCGEFLMHSGLEKWWAASWHVCVPTNNFQVGHLMWHARAMNAQVSSYDACVPLKPQARQFDELFTQAHSDMV